MTDWYSQFFSSTLGIANVTIWHRLDPRERPRRFAALMTDSNDLFSLFLLFHQGKPQLHISPNNWNISWNYFEFPWIKSNYCSEKITSNYPILIRFLTLTWGYLWITLKLLINYLHLTWSYIVVQEWLVQLGWHFNHFLGTENCSRIDTIVI